MKNTLISLVVLFIAFANSYGQEEKCVTRSLGLGLGANMNMHSPSFDFYDASLRDRGSVNFSENTNTLGLSIALSGILPINNIMAFRGSIAYNGLGGDLQSDNYTLETSLNYLEITPALELHNLVPVDNLYFVGALEMSMPIGPEYSFKDDAMLTENETLPDVGMRFAIGLGAGYRYKINKNWFLAPELSFRIPIGNVSSNEYLDSWNVPQIRFSVSVNYSFDNMTDEPVIVENPFDVGFKEIRYYDDKGETHDMKHIKVEEVQYNELFPLVPYVFFDENTDNPGRKHQEMAAQSEAGEFVLESIPADAMLINRLLLDVVGRRMQTAPRAVLTITGTTDGQAEKGNENLAIARAEFVKNYLMNNYDIHSDKINVKYSDKPGRPSSSKLPEGIAENRRIELFSNNPRVLAPIKVNKDNQTLANPDNIEFVPYVESDDSIRKWTLEISQAGETIRDISGSGDPSSINMFIIPNELSSSQVPLDYSLTVQNFSGQTAVASGSIPIDFYSSSRKKTEDLPDVTISKFSLILFDFDKSTISPQDKLTIDQHILPAIRYNSIVNIFGYTDMIGNENYNMELASRRADTVMDYLKSKVKSAKYTVYGIGEKKKIFDNSSPIGRHLSRTVQIEIITPR